MKTSLSSLIVLMATITSFAQITLTNFHNYDIGTTATFLVSTPFYEGLEQVGENVVWDASVEGNEEIQLSYSTASDAQNTKLYPETNLAVTNITEGWEAFYEVTDTEVTYNGFIVNNFLLQTYTDPLTELILPMSYGDSFTDTYEFENKFDWGEITTETGTLEVTADSYGDLVLPYGIIQNTLRIKYVENGTEEQGGTTCEKTVISYKWFDLEYGSEIAEYTIQKNSPIGIFRNFQYLSEMDYTSIKNQSSASKLKIYPNPASEYFQISGVDFGSEYKLINHQGQEVLSGTISGEERIYTTEFSTGIYFLEIKNNKGISRKKIVLQ